MKLEDFCKKVNSPVPVAKLVGRSYFAFGDSFNDFLAKHPFFIGEFIGFISGELFLPSIDFLQRFSRSCPRKAFLSGEGAWLFVCGRDVFRKSVVRWEGHSKVGEFVVIVNEFDECLGYGELVNSGDVVIKNLFDIGMSLRKHR